MTGTWYKCPDCDKQVDCSNGVPVDCPHCVTDRQIIRKVAKPKAKKQVATGVPASLGKTGFKLDIPIMREQVEINYVRHYAKSKANGKDYNAFYYDGHWHSIFELWFYAQWERTGYPMPIPEYAFCSKNWRFDFAWEDAMIAVELEGGVYSGGRHTRGSGFKNDIAKYNTATALGWRVYRFADKKAVNIEFMKARFAELNIREDAA